MNKKLPNFKKSHTWLMVIGSFISLITAAKAQIINVDKTDTLPYSEKAKVDGNMSLGLEIDKQNSVLYDGSNFFDASIRKSKTFVIFSASNRFTSNDSQDFLNTGYVHLRVRNHYKAPIHPESFLQYQWDAKIGISHRIVGGENIRFSLIKNNRWEITAATGVMYENESWNYSGVDTAKHLSKMPNISTSLLKSNNYLKVEGKVSENSSLKLAFFYQASYTSLFKPRIFTVFSFNVGVTKHFGIGFNFIGTYDSKPIVPIPNFYYSLSNNLVYTF